MSLWPPSHRLEIDEKALSILPSREQARPLVQYFIQKVNWIYHLVHVPTLERNFTTLYDDIEGKQQPRYEVLALMSTVFALSTYFQDLQSLAISRRWTLLAQSALCAANYVTEPTLETIQCVLLIAQHLLPNVGGIAIFRVLFSTALHSARSLACKSGAVFRVRPRVSQLSHTCLISSSSVYNIRKILSIYSWIFSRALLVTILNC
jgi:hypothetical protein